jgi:hypothetical protein
LLTPIIYFINLICDFSVISSIKTFSRIKLLFFLHVTDSVENESELGLQSRLNSHHEHILLQVVFKCKP